MKEYPISSILEDYRNNLPVSHIAARYRLGKKTLTAILSTEKPRDSIVGASLLKLSPEVRSKIKDLYRSGGSTRSIALALGVSRIVVTRQLQKDGIALRPAVKPRLHAINEHFFDNIDNEEKAYFLGLFYADGNVCLSRGQYHVQISLQAADREILEELSKRIYAGQVLLKDLPAKRRKFKKRWYLCKPACLFRCSGSIIGKSLISQGVVPKKSLVLTFPSEEQVPRSLRKHFIRGYFDGDGSIGGYARKASPKNRLSYSCSFISSTKFVERLREIIIEETGLTLSRKKKQKNHKRSTAIIELGGNRQVGKLMSWLYEDSSIYLRRKYAKFVALRDQNISVG